MIVRINFSDEVCCRRELLGACLQPNLGVSHNIEPMMVRGLDLPAPIPRKFVCSVLSSLRRRRIRTKKSSAKCFRRSDEWTCSVWRQIAGGTDSVYDQTKRCGRPLLSTNLILKGFQLILQACFGLVFLLFSPTIKTDFGTEKHMRRRRRRPLHIA